MKNPVLRSKQHNINGGGFTFHYFLRPYYLQAIVTLVLILTANGCSLILPWAIKIIFDDVLKRKDISLLNSVIGIVLLSLGLRVFINYKRKVIAQITGERIVCDIRETLYKHVQKISLAALQRLTPSQILSRLNDDVNSIRLFIFSDLVEGIYAGVSILLISGILFCLEPLLGFVALGLLPFFAAFYLRMLPRVQKGIRKEKEFRSKLFSRMGEVLNAMSIVRVFLGQEHENFSLRQQHGQLIRLVSSNQLNYAVLWSIVDMISTLAALGVLWAGSLLLLKGKLTIGELTAFYAYTGMLFAPVMRLVLINNSYQDASAALDRINTVFDIEISSAGQEHEKNMGIKPLTGRIEFHDVSFSYESSKTVLQGISFSVNAGDVLGVVGPSGAGKTTLMNVLLGLCDPSSGEIKVDGHSMNAISQDDYLKNISVVLQDDFLFNATVEENIRYGTFNASLKEVQEAARIAQADGFIGQLAGGYQFVIGERGRNLSNGQRQRIAIARALLKNPSILILDEATSAVDAITENAIQASVREFMRGKTIIIIAHRFSSLMDADQIIVLDKGRLIETGSHNNLLKKNGFYSTLYAEQFKETQPV